MSNLLTFETRKNKSIKEEKTETILKGRDLEAWRNIHLLERALIFRAKL